MRRGQISIELFFALSLFVLVLYWLLFFFQDVQDLPAQAMRRQSILAGDIADMAWESFVDNVSFSIAAPCILFKEKNVTYAVRAAGNRVEVGSVMTGFASAQFLAAFAPTALSFNCCAGERLSFKTVKTVDGNNVVLLDKVPGVCG